MKSRAPSVQPSCVAVAAKRNDVDDSVCSPFSRYIQCLFFSTSVFSPIVVSYNILICARDRKCVVAFIFRSKYRLIFLAIGKHRRTASFYRVKYAISRRGKMRKFVQAVSRYFVLPRKRSISRSLSERRAPSLGITEKTARHSTTATL